MSNEGKTSSTGRDDAAPNGFTASHGRDNDARGDQDKQRHADGQASFTGALQNSARTLTREIKREGRRLVEGATESATSAALQKKGAAAGYLRTVGEAITNSCDVLDDRGYRGTSGFVRHVAEEIGMLADNIEDKKPRDLLSEVRSYARANPAIFLGATLLAGFGIVRLLKSDDEYQAEGQEEEDYEEQDYRAQDESEYDYDEPYDDNSYGQQPL